jgi:type II secretory pathway component GspD/PulD (secretin)
VDTEHNESGQTKVVVEQPIVQITDSTSTTTSQVQFNYVDVGNILRVTPQLRPDGLMRLQIHPELSNITGTVTAGQSSAPIIQERSTEAIVTCPINKVCILGGLQDLFHVHDGNKIPILGDIPVLRWFFSSERDENQTRNLVLLVHPTVIDYDSPKYAEAIDTYVKSYEWRPEYGDANNKNVHSNTDPRWDAELAAPADVPVSRLSPPLPQTDRQPVPRTPAEE